MINDQQYPRALYPHRSTTIFGLHRKYQNLLALIGFYTPSPRSPISNMTLAAFCPFSFLAVAAALVATLSSSHFASAVDWNATTCEDLASLPTGNLTEDSALTIRGVSLTCDEVGTACEIFGMLPSLYHGMHSPLTKFDVCWIGLRC